MLEKYFTKMSTIDRYQGSWMGPEIEKYVTWLAEHDYKDRCIWSRTPIIFAFGEFAGSRGATTLEELPALVDAFVEFRGCGPPPTHVVHTRHGQGSPRTRGANDLGSPAGL